jgi:cytoskeletal protein CcmA (bactofilin family)
MGNITATQVMVGGVVEGNVSASARLEVMSTGTIEGDIHYGALVIDEGAQIMGRMISPKGVKSPLGDA